VVFGAVLRPQHLLMVAAAGMFLGWRGLMVGAILCECGRGCGGQGPGLQCYCMGPAAAVLRSRSLQRNVCSTVMTLLCCLPLPLPPLLLLPCADYVWVANGSGAPQQQQQRQHPGNQHDRLAAAQGFFNQMLGQAPLGRGSGSGGGGAAEGARRSGGGGQGAPPAAPQAPADPWASKGKGHKLGGF
jgi:hypothetical protein